MATNPRLSALMDALLDELTAQVKGGSTKIDADTGEVVKESAPAAILNVARQFLKDNGVDVPAGDDKMKVLVGNLPFDTPADMTRQ